MSMRTSLLMTGITKPEEALTLPKGWLKIGPFLADFSPEQVLEAARAIIMHFEHGSDDADHLFVSQAGVIVYFAKEIGIGPLEVGTV
jgi:hypothetical protein